MESFGVLMTQPMMPYLQEEISRRFKIFKLWEAPNQAKFLSENAASIQAIVGDSAVGAKAEFIDALPNLEIVATCSVGLDAIDLEMCKEKGIRVTNTPDVLTDCVADLTIGLIICTIRQLHMADRHVREGKWITFGNYKLTTRFSGKTVGIIGLGRIGLAIARRAEAFGCPITYYSRSEKPDFRNYKYYSNVTELATNSDILVVACPLTEETHHIISLQVIEALGPQGVLVNIGRGALVDEPEMVTALLDGRLGGAGIDVFEHEPEVPMELFGLDNVVLVPHVGSATWETRKEMADLVLGNLEAHVLKKPLLTAVV
ncbi:hydroxyphenylpyruvate reductase [Amborella trichopoda]|uniref:Glyoxylate reductase n=1 Tax=Amborella trichopoda TaxID=13333 RepID=W1NTR4_AMBTC|nr:hydroxyphenylpyruvate reductase [Amborella trichopoda]ERM98595.1 hypothetical protein AMTR_s00109p00059250 [Amborella trichopoda]|eukprot:XP_006833317.1 hydroxyphenylpyruvate reductase [Amborella trichopoda]